MSKVFFTSDLHLGHINIIKHCDRPFTDVNDMNKVLIDNWNLAVGERDTVYVLGDFAWKNVKDCNRYLSALNGKKILIKGNHDGRASIKAKGWQSIHDYLEIKHLLPVSIVLFHYPIASWAKKRYGSIHLHGHCHGTYEPTEGDNCIDVGVDPALFIPISLESIANRCKIRS